MGEKIRGTELLRDVKQVHFIGIGGSGMFPLVQILHANGYRITGSDNNESDTLQLERAMGIPVTLGHSGDNFAGADLIVHTAAILPDNAELVAAKASGIPVVDRSVLLGLVSGCYERVIGVSGTHGKTTTSAMLTQILLEDGIDPAAVIGGKLPAIGGNGRAGTGEVMVCEADEFVDTFLKLNPYLAVILNVDADHLEYFGTLENIIASFRKFAGKASGAVLYNGDDANSRSAAEGLPKRLLTFGWAESNDYYPAQIEYKAGVHSGFTLMRRGEPVVEIALHVPGRHNILNATAACAAALEIGARPEALSRGLDGFFGAGRRFEVLGEFGEVTVVDDYAHHPTEVAVTLRAAKELDYRKVWAVFQPFTYSRTALLLQDFADALSIADRVVLSEIMGSREVNTYGIHTKDLAEKIDGCVWFPEFEEIAKYVTEHAEPGDLVLTLGCGDIYKCAKMMVKK